MNRTSSTRICTTILRFTVILYCWLPAHHNVFAANVTVLDTDPSIVYSPVESWSPSSDPCSTCINPDDSMSYHEGINPAPSAGPIVVSTSSTSIPTVPPLPLPPAPTSSPNLVLTSGGGSPPTVSSSSPSPSPTDDDGRSHHGGKDGRVLARQLPNGSGSVDAPVTLSYNFTGS